MQCASRLLSPKEIAVQAGQQMPSVRLLERARAFAERDMRRWQRAAGHAMGDVHGVVPDLAQAQRHVLDADPDVQLPDADAIDAVSRLGAPPRPATLCSAPWHIARLKCTHGQGTAGVPCRSLQPQDDPGNGRPALQAVEAETCDHRGHGLEIVHTERDAHVEPVADDPATVPLDLLVAASGFVRHGVDLRLRFGDRAETDAAPG